MNNTQNLSNSPAVEMVTILVDYKYHTGTLVARHYYDATIMVDTAQGGATTLTGKDIEFF